MISWSGARSSDEPIPCWRQDGGARGEQVGVRAADESDDRSHQVPAVEDRDAGRLVLDECLDGVTDVCGWGSRGRFPPRR